MTFSRPQGSDTQRTEADTVLFSARCVTPINGTIIYDFPYDNGDVLPDPFAVEPEDDDYTIIDAPAALSELSELEGLEPAESNERTVEMGAGIVAEAIREVCKGVLPEGEIPGLPSADAFRLPAPSPLPEGVAPPPARAKIGYPVDANPPAFRPQRSLIFSPKVTLFAPVGTMPPVAAAADKNNHKPTPTFFEINISNLGTVEIPANWTTCKLIFGGAINDPSPEVVQRFSDRLGLKVEVFPQFGIILIYKEASTLLDADALHHLKETIRGNIRNSGSKFSAKFEIPNS